MVLASIVRSGIARTCELPTCRPSTSSHIVRMARSRFSSSSTSQLCRKGAAMTGAGSRTICRKSISRLGLGMSVSACSLASVWASKTLWGGEASPIQCEEALSPGNKGSMSGSKDDVKTTTTVLAGKSRPILSFFVWMLAVSVWAASLSLSGALVWAALKGKWALATAISVIYTLPHLIELPQLPPFCRRALLVGMLSWASEVRVVRFGASHSSNEHGDLKTSCNQLYCVHPHGAFLTYGIYALWEAVPGIRICGTPVLYWGAPLLRLLMNLAGVKFGSTRGQDFAQHMKSGKEPLGLVPGGFHEASISCVGEERVYLKKRKGFVKYALRHGYELVPCYTVGEVDLYSNPQGCWKLRWALNNFNLPGAVPFGFPLLPFLPKRNVPLTLAIGEPIRLPKLAKPTNEDVDKYHAQYVAALRDLCSRADAAHRGHIAESISAESPRACTPRTLQIW